MVKALGCRDSALRRDECGDWRNNGSHGRIYAVPGTLDEPTRPGFQIFVMGWTARGWKRAEEALSFARVTNDGDDEGAVFLDRLPTADEAAAIRHYVGVAKKRAFSDQELSRLRERAATMRQLLPAAA